MPETGPDSKGEGRGGLWIGIVFCSVAVLLWALLVYDALDGEIRVGGNRGGRVEVIRLDIDRSAFASQVAWSGILIGVVGLAGAYSIYRHISASRSTAKRDRVRGRDSRLNHVTAMLGRPSRMGYQVGEGHATCGSPEADVDPDLGLEKSKPRPEGSGDSQW